MGPRTDFDIKSCETAIFVLSTGNGYEVPEISGVLIWAILKFCRTRLSISITSDGYRNFQRSGFAELTFGYRSCPSTDTPIRVPVLNDA